MKKSNEIKKELIGKFGEGKFLDNKSFSVSTRGGHVRVTIKTPLVEIEDVQEYLKSQYESIDRCEYTGDILSGGNTFVFVSYDSEMITKITEQFKLVLTSFVESYIGFHVDRYDAAKLVSEKLKISDYPRSVIYYATATAFYLKWGSDHNFNEAA